MSKRSIINNPLFNREVGHFGWLRNEIDRLFEDVWKGKDLFKSSIYTRDIDELIPDIDVYESEDKISVIAELPGLDEKDISIELVNNVLIIKGEKKIDKEKKKDNYHIIERSYGSFHRTIQLPSSVNENEIKATFKNGLLNVDIKKEQPSGNLIKKIEIQSK